ncbi:MAG: hypothetical protein FWF72_00400, partial [Paludibacter sp.]|nr:hypothetical protein [Paludibacter sp.]
KKLILSIALLGFFGSFAFAQQALNDEQKSPIFYFGAGYGFDYGGIGGKIEFLPVKQFGIFAGVGYNFLSLGWNIGGTFKILPDKRISPNLMLMYGYNAVLIGSDAYSKRYEMTSYGLTAGVNVDFKIGRKDKISAGVFIPFRSNEFKENHKRAENDQYFKMTPLFPIGFSVGLNFGL